MAGKEISRTSLENKDGAPLSFYTEISLVRIFQGFDPFQWGNCIGITEQRSQAFRAEKDKLSPRQRQKTFI